MTKRGEAFKSLFGFRWSAGSKLIVDNLYGGCPNDGQIWFWHTASTSKSDHPPPCVLPNPSIETEGRYELPQDLRPTSLG